MSLFGKSREQKAQEHLERCKVSLADENNISECLYELESVLDEQGLTTLFNLLELISSNNVQNGSFSIQGKILNIQNGKVFIYQ